MITMRSRLLIACAVAMLGSGRAHAQRSDILPAQRRAQSVEQAAKIVEPRQANPVPADVRNPFAPPGFDQTDGEELPSGAPVPSAPGKAASRSSRDVLEQIAGAINPRGTISAKGELILLIGSRQARVGEELIVTFEGSTYTVVVSAIERTSFTIRLNNEEFTRPIKPGTKP